MSKCCKIDKKQAKKPEKRHYVEGSENILVEPMAELTNQVPVSYSSMCTLLFV